MNITDFRNFGSVTLPVGKPLDIVYPVARQAICQFTYAVEGDNYQLNGTSMSIWFNGGMEGNTTFPIPSNRKSEQLQFNVGDLQVGENILRCETVIFNFPGLKTLARFLMVIDGDLVVEREYAQVSCPAQTFLEEWKLVKA